MFILLCSPHSFLLIEWLTTSLILIIIIIFLVALSMKKPHQGSVNKLLYCNELIRYSYLPQLPQDQDSNVFSSTRGIVSSFFQ